VIKNVCDEKNWRRIIMKMKIISEKVVIFGLVLIFIGASVIPLMVSSEPEGGVWWNENWNYRKLITIDHTKVSGDLQNFPVLIHSTSSDFTNHAQSDGDDFVFVSVDTLTKYNHEIESYNSASGELTAWVNVTSLSSSTDTVLWLYYGNPTCSSQQNSEGTWDSSYYAVWHLNDNQWLDSTSNHRDLADGTIVPTSLTSGRVGNCAEFSGAENLQVVISNTDLRNFALEFWVYPKSIEKSVPISKSNDSQSSGVYYDWYVCPEYDSGAEFMLKVHIGGGLERDYWDRGDGGQSLNTWEYYTLNYFNGQDPFGWRLPTPISNDSPFGSATDSTTTSDMIRICRIHNTFYQDNVDEIRISTSPRNKNWHDTSYNNMNSPASFMSIGGEQPRIVSPTAQAGGPYYANVDNSITFDGSGSIDTDGTIVSWSWNFGDGATSIQQNPSHTYAVAETYTVSLTVTDNDGATDTDTAAVTVALESGAIPTAEANGPYSGYVNYPVAFNSAGSTGGSEGTIVSWYWTFGDGTVSSQQNPAHTYVSSGTFTVTLKVTNNYGQTDTDTTTATITELSPNKTPPLADAGGPHSGVVGSPITFDGSGSNDSDGTIVSYGWNFGDGTTGTGITPTHTYTTAGNYTVVLTVTDNDSLTNSNSTIASIDASGPPTILIAIDISNIEPIEEENEKTMLVTVFCYHQSVSNIHLEILESSNLTVTLLSPNITLNPGESKELLIKIKAPKLEKTNNSEVKVSDETIILCAVGDDNITSNTEQINLKVIEKNAATPGFETIATITAVGIAGALVSFFRRRNGNR
jgi:PKD repeat protein